MIGLIDVVDGLFPEAGRHYVLIDYAARWTSGAVVAGDDAADAGFFSFETALAMVDWEETRRIIRMARRMADADVMLTEPDSVA